jgi:hypothetical protein
MSVIDYRRRHRARLETWIQNAAMPSPQTSGAFAEAAASPRLSPRGAPARSLSRTSPTK